MAQNHLIRKFVKLYRIAIEIWLSRINEVEKDKSAEIQKYLTDRHRRWEEATLRTIMVFLHTKNLAADDILRAAIQDLEQEIIDAPKRDWYRTICDGVFTYIANYIVCVCSNGRVTVAEYEIANKIAEMIMDGLSFSDVCKKISERFGY